MIKGLDEYAAERRGMFAVKSDFRGLSPFPVTLSELRQAASIYGRELAWSTPIKRALSTVHPFTSTETGERYYLKASHLPHDFSLHVARWVGDETGGPVPFVDTSRYLVPFDFSIQIAAKGTSLADLRDETEIRAALAKAAESLRAFHETRLEGYGTLDPRPLFEPSPGQPRGLFDSWEAYLNSRLSEHVHLCYAAKVIKADEATRIETLLARAPGDFTPVLLHNDLSSGNIRVGPSGFIDWSDAIAGDPVFDLAGWCAFHMPERHETILRAYGAEADERFWLYFLRIVLARTVHRQRFAQPDDPRYPPASHRIQLALSKL